MHSCPSGGLKCMQDAGTKERQPSGSAPLSKRKSSVLHKEVLSPDIVAKYNIEVDIFLYIGLTKPPSHVNPTPHALQQGLLEPYPWHGMSSITVDGAFSQGLSQAK